MSQNNQLDVLYKEILANLFRLVTIYSSERIKAQKKYPIIYAWFVANNSVLEAEIRAFLRKNVKNPKVKIKKHGKYQTINLDLTEDDIVYEFTQYYWDNYQYHNILYNRALFADLEIKEKTVFDFFSSLSAKLTSVEKEGIELADFFNFNENYKFSSFVAKKRANQAIFKYFQMYAELSNPEVKLGETDLRLKFIELLKLIPYFSIFDRTAITGFSSYKTGIGKKYYSTLRMPLDFASGTLVDNLLHFLFQHLIELFYFEYLQDDVQNYNPQETLELVEEQSVINKRFDDRFNECNTVMKLLLQAWPKEQHLVYRIVEKDGSIIPVLRSILYENFLEQYEPIQTSEIILNDACKQSTTDAEARNRIEAFFKYLEQGFSEMSFDVKLSTLGATDDWTIELSNGREKIEKLTWTWNNIKVGYRTHSNDKKLFNY